MPGGGWNTSSPPPRWGAYFNFTAALQAAIDYGVTGTTAIIGTSDWGPLGFHRDVTGIGEYTDEYGISTNGTLRDGVLGALDGFDPGGAGRVRAFRVAGAAKAKATVVLDDGAAADALTLTAKYEGTRANVWHVTVQTNPILGANHKDLILYEAGVELERWEGLTPGNNDQFVTMINDTLPSQFITAAVTGVAGRPPANIVGVQAGVGGFAGGNSGLTVTSGDITTALGIVGAQDFDTINLANMTDDVTLDAFVAWLRDRNESGKRTFGVVGGALAETFTAAKTRTVEYDGAATYRQAALNLLNIGFTDLRRLSDDVVVSTAKLAARLAGTQAKIGFTRDLTNVRFTGYQVAVATTPANFVDGKKGGVLMFDNDTPNRVAMDSGVNALITPNLNLEDPENRRPPALQSVRNNAINHFIENTLSRVTKDLYLGQVANTRAGRLDLIGSFVRFLRDLEDVSALQVGESTVAEDDAYDQTGDAVFLKYGVKYAGIINRIFSTVRVSA